MIRKRREKMGISQEIVANRMGITQSYLTMLERDKRPWTSSLVASYLKAINDKTNGNQTK